MKYLYAVIAVLAVFADTVKWLLPADTALVLIYAAAALILAGIIFKGRPLPLRKDARTMTIAVLILVISYLIQGLTSTGSSFSSASKHAVYVSIPLLYIVVVQKFWPQFDITKLARIFLVLMIPINVIGVIQYFVNPSFLVLTTYSEDSAVILRNLLAGETFARYPSIFASADRYSSMALMQFLFSFSLLLSRSPRTRWTWAWILANMFVSVIALFIAGARSRVLIVGSEVAFWIGCYVIVATTSSRFSPRSKVASLIAIAAMIFVAAVFWPADEERGRFPVLELLRQSGDGSGEISARIGDAIDLSMVSDDATFFGEGLGVLSIDGRPGEFGIMTMWVESGLFWGSIMLVCFSSMIWILTKLSVVALLRRDATGAVVCSFPVPLLVFALLAGLTSSFELSTGMLMACLIAWITQHRATPTTPRRYPATGRLAQTVLRERTA